MILFKRICDSSRWPLALILWCILLIAPSPLRAAEALKIVLFGDSLIAGPYIPDNEKVNAQLQQQLQKYGVNAQVINAGVNGETTAGGLTRVKTILEMKPDVVVLALGANDMLRSHDPKVPLENLNALLYHLTYSKTVRVMLAGMMASLNHTQDYQYRFNAIYPTLAKHYGVEFFPFLLQDVAMVPELNLQDGMHPNGKGAAKIAENMTPYLLRLLGYYEKK